MKNLSINNLLKTNFNRDRVFGLDILRGLAILFVVIGHGSLYLPETLRSFSDFFTFDGVSIFFVLSGFLIGGILIKILENKSATIGTLFTFWIRRWFRTLPNYYFVLFLLLIALPYVFYGGMSNPFKKAEYLFFMQNLNKPHPNLFGEAWSLCVEEWFYLLVPIVIFSMVGIFKLSIKNSVLFVAVALIVTSMIFRYTKYLNIPINSINDWEIHIRKQVFTRLDSNMYGVIGAFVYYYYNDIWKKKKNFLFILGILLIIVHRYTIFLVGYGIYMCVFSFTLVSIGVLFILPFLSEFKNGSGFFYRFFTFISIISYSMYLLNLSVFNEYGLKLINQFSLTGIALIAARYIWYWFFTILGSFLLYRFYEKPMMGLRDKLV